MLVDLQLYEFRCFEQIRFEPSPGLNIILGPNAQGKTSLLEAACVLLRLQSPRTSSLAETVRFGQPAFSLSGHWDQTHLQLKYANGLKSFALDSKTQSRARDYLEAAKVAWFSNDALQLVRGTSSARRRYLDFLGTQTEDGYLRHLRAYERALRSRNALLKDNRPRREIAAFDTPLIAAGAPLLATRAALCRELQPLVAEAYAQICGGREHLDITYLPGSEADFAAALESTHAEETRLRSTLVGPHRDDLALHLDSRDAASFGSEGQQRSAVLALKLAQARHLEAAAGAPPLYLIDDVFGELDPARRNHLLAAMPANAQKLITTTNLDWFTTPEHATIHHLRDGQLSPAPTESHP